MLGYTEMQALLDRVGALFCHYSLVPIINNYHLDEIEKPQLQRLKTRLMSYNFTTKWLKDSKNEAPDALSHNPDQIQSPLTHLQSWM